MPRSSRIRPPRSTCGSPAKCHGAASTLASALPRDLLRAAGATPTRASSTRRDSAIRAEEAYGGLLIGVRLARRFTNPAKSGAKSTAVG